MRKFYRLFVISWVLLLLQTPGIVIGLLFGAYLTWVQMVIFGMGIMWGCLAMYLLRRSFENFLMKVIAQQNATITSHMKSKMESLMSCVKEFFDGTPITNHVIQSQPNGELKLRVGDESHMVEVDYETIEKFDLVTALEQAKTAWLTEEK